MLKADIVMNDGSELKDIILFTSQDLGDSQIMSKDKAEKLLKNNRVVFFSGKYVQGGISTGQISSYYLYEDNEYVKARLVDFVENTKTIYDTVDVADFIFDHRDEILKLIR